MRLFQISLAVFVVLILSMASARADTLYLKDGRVLEGTVKSETRTTIVFEAVISNIRTEMTFRRNEIDRIEAGAAPAQEEKRQAESNAGSGDAPVRTRDRARTPARPSSARSSVQYIVIPIHGGFGEDIAPAGVEDALTFAERRGIDHVVFHIDSPGGYAWAAEQIAQSMRDHGGSLTYTALIDDAFSAACWVALGCDRIFMAPGSSMGAATGYTRDNSTGEIAVDAKFNSASAARLASIAQSNGHSAVMARAFILLENEAYAVELAPGEWSIVEDRPTLKDTPIEQLASSSEILSLTAEEAARYGVATIASTEAQVGDALGLGGWTRFNNYGEAAMRKANRALARGEGNPVKIREDVAAIVELINRGVERAQLTAPENITPFVHPDSGLMTQASQEEWTRRCDETLDVLVDVSKNLGVYEDLLEQLREMGVDGGNHEWDLDDVKKRLRDRIAFLKQNRQKRYWP